MQGSEPYYCRTCTSRYAKRARVRRLECSVLRKVKRNSGNVHALVDDSLEILERRSYKTYRARLEAEKRLRRSHHAWNFSSIAASVATAIASIALLVDPSVYGKRGEAMLVFASVLTFALYLAAATLDYSGRSRNMFINYRKIQALSERVERLRKFGHGTSGDVIERLWNEYDALLDESENHASFDYYRTRSSAELSEAERWALRGATALLAIPYVTGILPILLLGRLIWWLASSA